MTTNTGDPTFPSSSEWPYHYYPTWTPTLAMQGWECPRCHRILSPLKESCSCSGYGSSVWPTYIYSSTKATLDGGASGCAIPLDASIGQMCQMTPEFLSSGREIYDERDHIAQHAPEELGGES